MNLEEKIMADLKKAMREKDPVKRNALRAVKSAILLAKTEKGKSHDLTPEDELKILQKLVKQRNESAAIYREQNRMDLYEKENAEAALIGKFLPPQLSTEELRAGLQRIIQETGATTIKDMGKVMGIATKKYAGKADGNTISTIVREILIRQ
ncbi:MAG: GatB/YqeY domain-containing protein [Chlorobi bacterium]|nr:GatB/YqeY domain-containing protein [Chlorobiota bacterium]